MKKLTGKTYRERSMHQLREWVSGNSIHNNIDDECCPDFSCCKPKLLAPAEKRQEYFNASAKKRYSMCAQFLAAGLSGMGHKVITSNVLAVGAVQLT